MTHTLSPKSLALLRYAALPQTTRERHERYEQLADVYSDRAVIVKLEELTRRGYLAYGTSPRGAWLTEKGSDTLAAHAVA